jgi:16S rRNA (adenine1518-N6/adenine1519-N6)-dimethyltransferase
MVQKEVADRLAAKPGTKAYGALTLCAQYYSRPRKILDVPARCFKPKPKVDSAFMELEVKTSFPLSGESERHFFALVRAIFQSRRKILSNSLKSLGKPIEKVQEALRQTGIDPQIRGEQLGLDQLIELTKALE